MKEIQTAQRKVDGAVEIFLCLLVVLFGWLFVGIVYAIFGGLRYGL